MPRNAELLAAVQPQPACVVTVTDPLLAPPTADADVGADRVGARRCAGWIDEGQPREIVGADRRRRRRRGDAARRIHDVRRARSGRSPSVCVWPSPIACPISCSSTRVKFGGVRNDALRSGGVLEDDVAAREGRERRAVDRASGSAGPSAADGQDRSTDLVVRIFERDDASSAGEPGEWAISVSLKRRAAVLKDDRRGRRSGPRGERLLKLGRGIPAREGRCGARVDIPGYGRGRIGLNPAKGRRPSEEGERLVGRLQLFADSWRAART